MSATPVYEIVTYKLNAGVAPEAFRAMAARMDPVIRAFPGLRSREVLHDAAKDEWAELCLWSSLEAALDAAQKAMASPELAPYFALMDMASIDMRHFATVPLPRAIRA